MNTVDITYILDHPESELLECKHAERNFDFDDIGKYFSALSNEANLFGKSSAWLIFGIQDKTHKILGTAYRTSWRSLQSLKKEIADKTTNRISFINIFDLVIDEKRIVVFQIPPAPHGIPIARDWHYYARDHESLVPLNLEKIERIRKQHIMSDRSREVCDWATIDDLDSLAIQKAREMYTVKNPNKKDDIREWDDVTFLNKAKLTIQWKVTNTALLLLWKEESSHFLVQSNPVISRILKNNEGIERDYEHFSLPFLLSVNKVFEKIRKLKYRYIIKDGLFPEETDSYDPFVLREMIHNAVAHQDYTLQWKINIVEDDDKIVIANKGAFIPWSIESVINADAPSEYYRNTFLVQAMVNLNMIDTIGSGIKRAFLIQKEKYFPLPDYVIADDIVRMTLYGKVIDINYARKLASMAWLHLNDIMLLDAIQKNKSLTNQQIDYLKRKKLIEWRKPNFHISLSVAQKTNLVDDYVMLKSSIDEQRNKVLKFISWHKNGVSKDWIKAFLEKNKILEEGLSLDKKNHRLQNILTYLKEQGNIHSLGAWNKSLRKAIF